MPAHAPAQSAHEPARSSGQHLAVERRSKSLQPRVQAKMEAAFGHDVSSLRIHGGGHAELLGALAYTRGRDTHVALGRYNSTSRGGNEPLGHEPASVVQPSTPIQLKGGRQTARRRARRRRAARNRAARERFLGLSDGNAWREIIDERHHEHGAQVYDQGLHAPEDWEGEGFSSAAEAQQEHSEPGYLASAMAARRLVAGSIGQRIDADFLERVHAAASAHKEEADGYHRGYRNRGDRESTASFAAPDDFQAGTVTAAVGQLNPQFTAARTEEGVGALDVVEPENLPAFSAQDPSLVLHFKPQRSRAIKAEVNRILHHHYRRIGRQRTTKEKLRLIAKTHRQLENLHPFLDANTRTNRLILHKLMVESGLSPVVLNNPLQVHLKTHDEWADELQRGMTRWQELQGQQE